MARWVPNPIYGDPNGGDFIDDAGNTWPDPTGQFRTQAQAQPIPNATPGAQPAPPMMTTPAGAADFINATSPQPATKGEHAPPGQRRQDDLQSQLDMPPDPEKVRGAANGGSSAAGGPPDPEQVRQASPYITATQTTTDKTEQTSGLTAEAKGKVESATQHANEALDQQGQAETGRIKAEADLQRKQARDAYGRGVNQYFEALGQKQMQDQIVSETSQALDEASKFKPDRAQLFHNDHGVLFAISSAIAAMAGGWMMGRGLAGKNVFLDSIFKMIDDNANDQIAQNSAVMKELTRRLGSAEAAAKELKARMYGAVQDTIEAQTRFEKADLVQQGAAGVLATINSKKADNELNAAKLTADTKARTVQTRTQSQLMANPAAYGGVDIHDPKEYARVGKVSDLANLAAEAKGLAKDGTLAGNVGFLDGKWNWIKGAFNARDPGQARVENLRARWELLNRADWASEPNGQETQKRLSEIDFPQNDQEIPMFLQRVDEALNLADPGGRYRFAAKALGNRPNAVEQGRIPIVGHK